MNDSQTDCWLDIISEMEQRRQKGLLAYSKPVDANDVEDWLKHAEEEFLDGAVYTRAARYVVERLRSRITELEDKLYDAYQRINLLITTGGGV
jgi:hypothetical protein